MSDPDSPSPATQPAEFAEPIEPEPIELAYSAPSLEDRRRAWPPPILVRLVYAALGIAGPVAGLALNSEPDEFGVPVDWQNGEPLAWLTLATLPEVLWPLAPFLLASWAAMAAVCIAPRRLLTSRWVELGLLMGVLMGLEYAAVVAAGLADGDAGDATVNLLVLQFGLGGLVGIVALLILDALMLAARRHQWLRLALIILAVAVAMFMGLSILTGSSPMGLLVWPIFALPVAAPLAALAYGMMLHRMHLGRLEQGLGPLLPEDPAGRKRLWLLGGLILLLNLLAWIIVRIFAARAYSQLPVAEPPRCFVATAATRAPSSATTGHRQLRRLRALEGALRERHPLLHGLIRRLYDETGPWLADHIRTGMRAELAFRLLRPLELLAVNTLRRIDRS